MDSHELGICSNDQMNFLHLIIDVETHLELRQSTPLIIRSKLSALSSFDSSKET